ncbi:hypothetical protein CEXT_464131 [Caerostris extrusa]|uniref:Uncharacterized protein n=1 Tax=Caerostris extrusa TaxID=172846 RepID=A0AAV4VPN9_CAEEX|nr:hypothetical protein CEXT_464131 [Caerostris extrusa]
MHVRKNRHRNIYTDSRNDWKNWRKQDMADISTERPFMIGLKDSFLPPEIQEETTGIHALLHCFCHEERLQEFEKAGYGEFFNGEAFHDWFKGFFLASRGTRRNNWNLRTVTLLLP